MEPSQAKRKRKRENATHYSVNGEQLTFSDSSSVVAKNASRVHLRSCSHVWADTHRMVKTWHVVLYVDIMRISALSPSRECCRQPNGRSFLPSHSDRACIVGHARTLANHHCLQEASHARPCKTNSNCSQEKHEASMTRTHRITGRFARRN